MNEKLEEIIEYTKVKFNLDNYYLKRHHIFREKSSLHRTSYLLSMEWFPNETDYTDSDYNPSGTAVIDIDIHTNSVKRAIFAQDVSYASQAEFLEPTDDNEKIIEWVEEMTGLEFGRQFLLSYEAEGAVSFQAAVDNITVYPVGTIEVEFNENGQLTLFSIDGVFPHEDQIKWEPFSLTPDKVEPFAQAQSRLLEVPLEEEEKWFPVYAISTAFITNNDKRIISFEEVEKQKSFVKKDVVLEWEHPVDEAFIPAETDLSTEVSIEEAMADTDHPDKLPLTEADQEEAVAETRSFLQRVFPEDSGKWSLKELRYENGYVYAELQPVLRDNRVIVRKLQVILDADTYKALNYIDTIELLNMFQHFERADEPTTKQGQAFDKLRDLLEVTPVYVYDKDQGSYILCGKIDCAHGVDAVTGEVILLDEL
ncbi:hypothetical protein QGM71_11410 [Virgibacillus sp. C22-A2]|uniref:DUF4901 domain-containing protein n=1 Tax=Virgibacillus tibetensis TaxID=3042313 RepID=A0ABU6KI59_9BACI|nr:hypothetical protein [Virgibacillus sp. C22-A2]